MRRALVVIALVGCGGPSNVERVAPAPPPPPPITTCGDLAKDSIAGLRLGMDEAAVRAVMGPPSRETAPEHHVHHQRSPSDWWTSSSTWDRHGLEVSWVALGDVAAPRTIDGVKILRGGDVTTSCGVRPGATRADVERAYAHAIAALRGSWLGPLVAADGSAQDAIVFAADDGSVLGGAKLEGDRVVEIGIAIPDFGAAGMAGG